MADTFDTIVVGAGAVGSAAAYHAAKAGRRTVLLEQFEIDHQMGSSYGASRIIRYAYDNPTYVELAKAAYPAWRETELEAGEQLLIPTGGIDFGPADEPGLTATRQSLAAAGIGHEVLGARTAAERFPQWRFDEDMAIVFQPDAGVLRASACVRAHVRLARRRGAVVRENTAVARITVASNAVEVDTTAGRYSAGSLILAPGAWGGAVFGMVGLSLPLQPVRTQEQYFAAAPADDYLPGRFPVFIAHLAREYGWSVYGIPDVDGSGVKVAMHGGTPISDMNAVDRAPDPDLEARARRFMARHLPGANGQRRTVRVCLYTMTPDEHFVVDRHPAHPHVVISASCSGHAFKFSNLIGRILADLAAGGDSGHDLSLFRLSRFGATA